MSTKKQPPKCNCGSRDNYRLGVQKFGKKEYDLYQCNACGTSFTVKRGDSANNARQPRAGLPSKAPNLRSNGFIPQT